MIDLYKGDCIEIMQNLIKQGVKVDAIITDPPYGTTACKCEILSDCCYMVDGLIKSPEKNKLIKEVQKIIKDGE